MTSKPMAIQRSIGSVSIAPLPTASRGVTVARILRCIVIDTLLEALLCWVNEQRTHRNKPSLPLMARCYVAPFGKYQGCASVGHGLRYRKWAGVKPESNP